MYELHLAAYIRRFAQISSGKSRFLHLATARGPYCNIDHSWKAMGTQGVGRLFASSWRNASALTIVGGIINRCRQAIDRPHLSYTLFRYGRGR